MKSKLNTADRHSCIATLYDEPDAQSARLVCFYRLQNIKCDYSH